MEQNIDRIKFIGKYRHAVGTQYCVPTAHIEIGTLPLPTFSPYRTKIFKNFEHRDIIDHRLL